MPRAHERRARRYRAAEGRLHSHAAGPQTLAVDDYAPIADDIGEKQGIRLGIVESDEINTTPEHPFQLFA